MNQSKRLLIASLTFLSVLSSSTGFSQDKVPLQDPNRGLLQLQVYNSAAKHLVASLESRIEKNFLLSNICSANTGDEQASAVNLVEAFKNDVVIPAKLKIQLNLTREIRCLGNADSGFVKRLTTVCKEIQKTTDWSVSDSQKNEMIEAIKDAQDCMTLGF